MKITYIGADNKEHTIQLSETLETDEYIRGLQKIGKEMVTRTIPKQDIIKID